MATRLIRRAVAGTTLVVVAVLTGCAGDPGAQPADPGAAESRLVEPLLAEHGLDAMDAVEIIDHLDRLGGTERPADLVASVRPDALLLTGKGEEQRLEVPGDRFYLSVAPYVDQTHDCFHHSLTTCQGELASREVHVRIVDDTTGTVLVDETRTTFANGFTGFWLPRDIEGTLRVEYDGRSGEVPFATDPEAPTCLTTLRLT